MGVYETMVKAMEDKDAETYIGLLHDDFEFVRHQSGTTMSRAEMVEMLQGMLASDSLTIRDQRKVYENDDILVEHSFMSFPDGTTEAVMTVCMLKDGKVARMETGATPIAG